MALPAIRFLRFSADSCLSGHARGRRECGDRTDASSPAGRRCSARRRCRRRAPAASAACSARPSSAVDGWVPLMSARPSFGASATGASPARASASAPDTRPIAVPRLAFADEDQRQVRERRQIAAGANRSARRHDGMHAVVEQIDRAARASRGGCRSSPLPARSRAAPSSRARPAPDSGSPTPAAWLRSRLTCSSASESAGIRTSAKLPNPVLMP